MNGSEKVKEPIRPTLELRWKNFRSFKDTGWFRLRPITIILGANNSGKTNLVRPLLLLKQTVDSADKSVPLKITGPLTDLGTYRNMIYGRNSRLTLEFGIRFHSIENISEDRRRSLLASWHPGGVILEFGMGDGPLQVELRRLEIQDAQGRSRVVQRKLASGSYSISTNLGLSQRFVRLAKRVEPRHFMFQPFDIVRRLLNEQSKSQRERARPRGSRAMGDVSASMPGKSDTYFGFAESAVGHMTGVLSEISYIGPLREYPRRYYESIEEVPASVGTRGELAPQILYLTKDKRTKAMTKDWLRRFGLARDFVCDSFHEDMFALRVEDLQGRSIVDYSDAGFGLSQLLPLVVQGFHSSRQGILFLEQPEIHLNPKLQSQLANLFAEVSKDRKIIIVETHSEHLVMRIRALINEGVLSPEEVALFYVEKPGATSSLREIPIAKDGHIEPDKWPVGFFEDALSDALRLARRPKVSPESKNAG